jgi:hypothetical protein
MAQWARISGGIVAELTDTDPTGRYHPSLIWEPCDANVRVGWTYADGTFAAPMISLAAGRAAQIALLRTACDAAITGGYTSSALGSAHSYPSTPTDQANMAASVLASLLPDLPAGWTTPFWCEAGDVWAFTPHTAAQIQQAGRDGKAMIVAAQSKLATLSAEVAAATTVAAVQAIVW